MTESAAAAAAQVVQELFDAKAANWSSKYAPGGRLTGRLAHLAATIQRQTSPGQRVLDLGCGTGNLARHLAAADLVVTGCDISAEMLHRAANADPEGLIDWIALAPGWRTLPFADNTFDATVVSSVLEYVENPMIVLRECARVLRPGGKLLCTVPDQRHPVRWLECMARAVTRYPLIEVLGGRRPRLQSYLTYLRISRQRHSSRWWRATAAQAALRPVRIEGRKTPPTTLRLLIFCQQHDAQKPR
jgi:ubiquinone/menaquinone biosynthesis C-methylase UbiE